MSKYPSQKHIEKTIYELAKNVSVTSTKHQLILLVGETTQYRHDTDRELAFRQESNFYYLTGCAVPSSAVLVEVASAFPPVFASTLFIPPVSEDVIMWSVSPPSLDMARNVYDATAIRHTTELPKILQSLPQDTVIHVLPTSSLYPSVPSDVSKVITTKKPDDTLLLPGIQEARITKTPQEIELIRKANAISSRAHECVMRTLGLAVQSKIDEGKAEVVKVPSQWMVKSEADAEALFAASCRREGCVIMLSCSWLS
jgi:Xaa-Pro dipeptidase